MEVRAWVVRGVLQDGDGREDADGGGREGANWALVVDVGVEFVELLSRFWSRGRGSLVYKVP